MYTACSMMNECLREDGIFKNYKENRCGADADQEELICLSQGLTEDNHYNKI